MSPPAAKNDSIACPRGSSVWISLVDFSGGKTKEAASRRSAISRNIASCVMPMAANLPSPWLCRWKVALSLGTSGMAWSCCRNSLACCESLA